MFNPEKLLGGLLMGGSRRRGGLGSLVSGGAALGFAGVALEAVEHFMNKSKVSGSDQHPPGPASGHTVLPPKPPPAPGMPSAPPLPSGGTAAAPPPPPSTMPAGPSAIDDSEEGRDAVLLIRAMIAAANADGVIDQEERNRILGKLETVDLSEQEHSFVVRELLSPADMDNIVTAVTSREMGKQVYMVSLLAIEVDTDAERTYINTLAQRLGLEETDINDIHRKLGIEKP
jgi:uncharacterized membrane protein YebE (DUF533 family)